MNETEIINQEIENKIVIIYGKMWRGKTLNAILTATFDFPKRIYWNVKIYKNDKELSKFVWSKSDIEKIRFSYTPWLLVMDEGAINMNSRRSLSNINLYLTELIVLSRKKNCSLIFISQAFENLDINVSRLCDLIIEMQKIKRQNMKPLFIANIKSQFRGKLLTTAKFKIDILKHFEHEKIKYNTLESSKIDFNN